MNHLKIQLTHFQKIKIEHKKQVLFVSMRNFKNHMRQGNLEFADMALDKAISMMNDIREDLKRYKMENEKKVG